MRNIGLVLFYRREPQPLGLLAMSKRLGKRERAKLRAMQGAKGAIIRRNLSSPVERSYLTSPSARDTLLTHSHSGFRDPKGNLAKARTINRVRLPQHRYSIVNRESGNHVCGADSKVKANELAKHMREQMFINSKGRIVVHFEVIDTQPWLAKIRG